MISYNELKERQQKEVNAFPIHFAFGPEQFKEEIEKMGLSMEEAADNFYGKHVIGIGAGGFILKADKEAFVEMCKRHNDELEELKKDRANLFSAFVAEMNAHEFAYTEDPEEALKALGITAEQIKSDPEIKKIFDKAKKFVMEGQKK